MVVRDPEVKRTRTNKIVAQVTIAAKNVQIGGQDVDADKNKWQTAVFWGNDALKAAELKKGAEVRMFGEHVVREFEGKDAKMRLSSEIHKPTLELLSPAKEREPGTPIDVTGTVVRSPELKMTGDGQLYTHVSIAATAIKRAGEDLDVAVNKWQKGVFWGAEAKSLAGDLKRGDKVSLFGEAVTREYQTNGETKSGTEIHRGKLEVLERAANPQEPRRQASRAAETDLGR